MYILAFGAFLLVFLLKKGVRRDLRTGVPPSSPMTSSILTSIGGANGTSIKLSATFPSIC